MPNKTLEKWAWVLIYAGLAIGGFGIWFMAHNLAVGWTVFACGAGLVGAGAVLIWVRSRRA